ncbi:hypothetical protein CB1_000148011 [Camelus ferus]|nr:hypothetical protein CB1_000148011 [Camelus ferus]
MCLVLLLCPDGTLGEELELQPHPSPRAAYWLPSFGQFNKYIEKLFNSSDNSKEKRNLFCFLDFCGP